MSKAVIYLKAEQNVEVSEPEVYMKDIVKVYSSDILAAEKVRSIQVYMFEKGGKKRQIVSILKIIELIEETCPGITVHNLGETDTLLEWVQVRKHKQPIQVIKVMIASGVSFFGTAFTIMAFHNDISVHGIFSKVYQMVMGQPGDGYTVLEVSYSVGLMMGIILFFNHIGGRRITKDPTPIEVAMRKYEEDVNKALVETGNREGDTIDIS